MNTIHCVYIFKEKTEDIKRYCFLNAKSDSNNYIQYFIYELNFGESKYAVEAITVDGKTYDLSTAEKLYDYILDSNKEKNIK